MGEKSFVPLGQKEEDKEIWVFFVSCSKFTGQINKCIASVWLLINAFTHHYKGCKVNLATRLLLCWLHSKKTFTVLYFTKSLLSSSSKTMYFIGK